MHEFPEILEVVSKENKPELTSILQMGLPWMKLNTTCPEFSDKTITEAIAESSDIRSKLKMVQKDANYQIRNWDGNMYFGPANLNELVDLNNQDKAKNGYTNDINATAKLHRNDIEFKWHVNEDHVFRKWINSWIDDIDLNIVNTFVFPPGGFLFPHADTNSEPWGLDRIYIPLRHPKGTEFGFFKFGNMPANEREMWLIDQYTHIHWAMNRSNLPKITLAIGCNLKSIEETIISSFMNMMTYTTS